MTIRIRTNTIVLLAQRVHPVPPSKDGVILACTVVVGVQTMHQVQFLAVVLVGLDILVIAGVSNNATKGVVVRITGTVPVSTFNLFIIS